MFDAWYDLPPFLRALMGLLLIAIAVGAVFLTGYLYRWNIVVGIIGFIMFAFSGAGHNKNGYRF